MFEVAVRHEPRRQIVTARGELDISTRPSLKQALMPLLNRDFDHVIVDLRAVDFMDASAAALLLSCAERARSRRQRFSLMLGGPASHRVLTLCGLLDRFDIIAELGGAAA